MFNREAGRKPKLFKIDHLKRVLYKRTLPYVHYCDVPGAKKGYSYDYLFVGMDEDLRGRFWGIDVEGKFSINLYEGKTMSFPQNRLKFDKYARFIERASDVLETDLTLYQTDSFRASNRSDLMLIVVQRRDGIAKEVVDPFVEWNMKSDRLLKGELKKLVLPPLSASASSISDEIRLDEIVDKVIDEEIAREDVEVLLESPVETSLRKAVKIQLASVEQIDETLSKISGASAQYQREFRELMLKSGKEPELKHTPLFNKVAMEQRLLKVGSKDVEAFNSALEAYAEELKDDPVTKVSMTSAFVSTAEIDLKFREMCFVKKDGKLEPFNAEDMNTGAVDLRPFYSWIDGLYSKAGLEVSKSSAPMIRKRALLDTDTPYSKISFDEIASFYTQSFEAFSRDLILADKEEEALESLRALTAPFSDSVSDILAETNELRKDFPFLADQNKMAQGVEPYALLEAQNWIVKILSQYPRWSEISKNITVSFKRNVRSHYDYANRAVVLDYESDRDVLIHEFVHSLESAYGLGLNGQPIKGFDLTQAMTCFLASRLDLESNLKYSQGEYIPQDEFADPYTAKMYAQGRRTGPYDVAMESDPNTEVLTMAVQEFVTPERALALAKRDYTHYLLGRALIEGRLLDFVAK